MTANARRRGEPLLGLVLLLGGWALVRGALWEAPFSAPQASPVALGRAGEAAADPVPSAFMARPAAGDRVFQALNAGASLPSLSGLAERPGAVRAVLREPMWSPPPRPRQAAVRGPARARWPALPGPAPLPLVRPRPPAGQQPSVRGELLQPPLLPALAEAARPLASPAPPSLSAMPTAIPGVLAAKARRRWSGDGWLFWRAGSGGFPAAGRASYGGSQAGAVLRYGLGTAGGRAPAAHARFSRALSFRDAELAAGLSARPVPGVPVRLLAEGRLQRAGTTRVRPAAALITELPPQPLPLEAEAELYAQAGYVGGTDATAFFDAQLTAERPALRVGPGELRVGAGLWAGGQKGASRLDLGPRATVRLGIAGGSSRLALDWRLRVAGQAEPGSGPTLTFSAGF